VNVTEGGNVTMGGSRIVDWDDQDRTPGEYFVPKREPDEPGDEPDDPGDDPGDPRTTIFFEETMGEGEPGPVKVEQYEGWKSAAARFTESTGNVEVRRHSALGPHIWFPPGTAADLRIEGVPEGRSAITLSYDIAGEAGGVRASTIRLYAGSGGAWTNKTPWVTKLIPSPVRYTRVTVELPDGITALRFVGDPSTNTHGMRLDNITLTGK
jgi:hypothetical protein